MIPINKIFKFIIKLPAIKLIGISRNSRLITLNLDKYGCIVIVLNIMFFSSIQIKTSFDLNVKRKFAPVAQLDRALGYGPGGSGFKS